MAQKNQTVNLVIQKANGKQGVIKVKQHMVTPRYITVQGSKILMAQSSSSKLNGGNVVSVVGGTNVNGGGGNVAAGISATHNKPTIRLVQPQSVALKIVNAQQVQSGNLTQIKQETTNGNINSSSSSNGAGGGGAATRTQHLNNSQSSAYPMSTKSSPSIAIGSKRMNTSVANTSQTTSSKRRKTDKVGKGLRHFSMKVCEKVKDKGVTSYNVVADELVAEETDGDPNINPASYDQKNIRRRVYDALNVLMAMDIISKEKKEIRWKGFPTSSVEECSELEKENQKCRERIAAKSEELKKLLLQQVSFQSLVKRNKEMENRDIVPNSCSAIQLPFIIINTHKQTDVNCSISSDKSEYSFKFGNKFEIYDDVQVLRRMSLLCGLDEGKCSPDDIERLKALVPASFEQYIEEFGTRSHGISTSSSDDEADMKDNFDEIIEEDAISDDGDEVDNDDHDDMTLC